MFLIALRIDRLTPHPFPKKYPLPAILPGKLFHTKKGQLNSCPFYFHQTPTGFAFSGSMLYCLIARATSFAVILPSFANAAIAAWAM